MNGVFGSAGLIDRNICALFASGLVLRVQLCALWMADSWSMWGLLFTNIIC